MIENGIPEKKLGGSKGIEERVVYFYNSLSQEEKSLLKDCKLTFKSASDATKNEIQGKTEDGKEIYVAYVSDKPEMPHKYIGQVNGVSIGTDQAKMLFERYGRIAGFQKVANELKGDKDVQNFLNRMGLETI